MPKHFTLLKAIAALLTFVCQAQAQSDKFFLSYDCRNNIEAFVEEIPVDTALQLSAEPMAFAVEEALIVIDTVDQWKTWNTVENYTYGKNRGELSMITDLNALHPYLRDKVIELIKICEGKGIEIAVVETYRTHAKQHEYRTMGRKYTRSGAGKSKHQYGLAVDVVPVVDSVAEWHNDILWKKIGVVGERLGLRWGGRWKRPYDPGHFEWSGGLTTVHLASGLLPLVPKKDQYPCLDDDMRLLKKYWREWETSQSAMTRK